MSIDEKQEDDLMNALNSVARMSWPVQRERIFRKVITGIMEIMRWQSVHLLPNDVQITPRSCRKCGCTEKDCRQCIERTGTTCRWVEIDLCSACQE